ncbi:fic family toxin-antitoxin system, toxin component [Streptomyces sp. NPDC060022]|uniref:fic family toxin-antitoxin system, toxin component n=1 Tax=Streptomyces sp. NPDC060022 TaxID=3347039 RepID=UPI0036B6C157
MSLHVDLSWILEVAERAGKHDPAPDDLGVPLAAVARHRAELLEQPVYGGPYARAAALVHTLGRCRWLECSNLTVACAVAVMYLNASGIPADPDRDQLAALARELYNPGCTAASITAQLRTWQA